MTASALPGSITQCAQTLAIENLSKKLPIAGLESSLLIGKRNSVANIYWEATNDSD